MFTKKWSVPPLRVYAPFFLILHLCRWSVSAAELFPGFFFFPDHDRIEENFLCFCRSLVNGRISNHHRMVFLIAIFQKFSDAVLLASAEKVRQNVIEVALDYLACGLDPRFVL